MLGLELGSRDEYNPANSLKIGSQVFFFFSSHKIVWVKTSDPGKDMTKVRVRVRVRVRLRVRVMFSVRVRVRVRIRVRVKIRLRVRVNVSVRVRVRVRVSVLSHWDQHASP